MNITKILQRLERSNMNTNTLLKRTHLAMVGLTGLLGLAGSAIAGHLVDATTGVVSLNTVNFSLTARPGYISTADGNSVYFWGFGNGAAAAQYPAPTLVVTQGQTVRITLNNQLPEPVSLLFPGQELSLTTTGGVHGILGRHVAPGGTAATYTFVASQPGTYQYQSGARADLHTEMGLSGALIVRPSGFSSTNTLNRKAYAHTNTAFDHEYLFFLSEMDENIHIEVERQVKAGQPVAVDMSKWMPVYWFINGRTAPDTMLGPGADAPWLPAQPYDCMPIFHPGEKVLMRVVGAGRDPHPFHHHGNHSRIIARDGRVLEHAANAGPTLAQQVFTIPSTPGGTIDSIFSWTGVGMGWDVYGHTSTNDVLEPFEDPASHGKKFPVNLPTDQNLTFGQMYGGTPFLGNPGILPPGEGGYNANNGFMYMWHSHAEKEIVNNNAFPGGMLTMALIEAWPPAPPAPVVPLAPAP